MSDHAAARSDPLVLFGESSVLLASLTLGTAREAVTLMLCDRIDNAVLAELETLTRSPDAIVLVMHREGTDADELRALRSGAAECLRVDFSVGRLEAQLASRLRRRSAIAVTSPYALEVDPQGFEATLGGRRLTLSPMEFRLLDLLWRHRGEVVLHAAVEKHIYEDAGADARQAVRQLVHRLRRRLGSDRDLLAAVPGIGYVLRVPSTAAEVFPLAGLAEPVPGSSGALQVVDTLYGPDPQQSA
jgi:DNA-binding response OmpR family regulator